MTSVILKLSKILQQADAGTAETSRIRCRRGGDFQQQTQGDLGQRIPREDEKRGREGNGDDPGVESGIQKGRRILLFEREAAWLVGRVLQESERRNEIKTSRYTRLSLPLETTAAFAG